MCLKNWGLPIYGITHEALSMESIKDIVHHVIGQMSLGDAGNYQQIQEAWERISKDTHSKVVAVKKGDITINADNSMRLYKLNLNRERFLKELQKEFPGINKIYFRAKAA